MITAVALVAVIAGYMGLAWLTAKLIDRRIDRRANRAKDKQE